MPKASKEPTRGGARKGAGAKAIYGENTVVITRRVPASKKDELAAVIDKLLKKWRVI